MRPFTRILYAIEFLLTLLTTDMLWSEIGGQSHLDMMPWYAKFGLMLALAWCVVRFTSAIAGRQRVWWLIAIGLTVAIMAGVTYYYHLHEESDQPGTDDNSLTSRGVSIAAAKIT